MDRARRRVSFARGAGVVAFPAEAPLGGGRPSAGGGQLTGGQRGLRPGQLRFREVLVESLPTERGDRVVQFADRIIARPTASSARALSAGSTGSMSGALAGRFLRLR